MSKPSVEKAPTLEMTPSEIGELAKYFSTYDVTDSNGEYLPWQKLKWRLPKQETVEIWKAIKLKRYFNRKEIPLKDENGKNFHYCMHSAMEAKLHDTSRTVGGSVGVVGEDVASNNIQRKYLVSSLIMEEAITSAQLEGAATTREIAKKMLEDERTPKNEDERMIVNNYLLLLEAEKLCKKELTVDMILDFHRISTQFTTENEVIPRQFREADDIYVGDGDGGIAHQPPPHSTIYDRLSKLCEFANEDHSGQNGCQFIYPVIKAIILHFMIGYEHPFRDGNGRTARALFYWYMLKSDYKLFKYVSISKLLKESPRKYGLSFLYCEKDENDLTYFIDFQLDIISKAIQELENYLKNKTNEFNEIVRLLEKSKHKDISLIQKEIIKKGTKEPGRIFTAKEISSDFGVSANTARDHLNDLVKRKLLLDTKDGRLVLYVSPGDIKSRLLGTN